MGWTSCFLEIMETLKMDAPGCKNNLESLKTVLFVKKAVSLPFNSLLVF